MEFSTIFAVAIGGGIGALLRYFIATVGQSWTTYEFPLGTLIVNIIGIFAAWSSYKIGSILFTTTPT